VEPSTLARRLKQKALELGFDLAGVCPAVRPSGLDRFRRWLAAGYAGRMRYLSDRAPAYEHPRHVLDGARSLLMLGIGYRTSEPAAPGPAQARVARYAWGTDYHDAIHDRLRRLAAYHRELTPGARVRGVVDTAPLLEREFAERAGLGWIGKNTLLLNRDLGSWLFLAALLSSEEILPDQPLNADHCGACRACLEACPTGALVEAYRLDARKCISYLTIELRDSVPVELREGVGDWLFGCDVCQEVCPWNRRAPASREPAFQPLEGANPVDLAAWFALDDEAFRARFRPSALWRAKRRGLLRNAALVLGNHPCEAGLRALRIGLGDPEPLVRAACAWALARYGAPPARRYLREQLARESDGLVREEIEAALSE
jgi:epoxyqueuosine reductase